jgi:hypothetical protein
MTQPNGFSAEFTYDAPHVESPAPSSPTLRPLAAGELIDQSVVFWRTHFKDLFRLYLAFQLIMYACTKATMVFFYRQFPSLKTGKLNPDELGSNPAEFFGKFAVLGVLVGVAWWLQWLTLIAGTHFTVRSLLGRPVSILEAVNRMFQRAATATVALILASTLAGLAYLVGVIPGSLMIGTAVALKDIAGPVVAILLGVMGGFLLLFGGVGGFLWGLLRLFLIPPVVSEESGGPLVALRRSATLMKGRIGPGVFGLVKVRASVLLTGLTAMLIVIAVMVSIPALTVQSIYGGLFQKTGPTPDAVPQYLLIPAELLQVGVQAVFAPLSMALAALFYVDLRVRREGLDLESRLAALGQP